MKKNKKTDAKVGLPKLTYYLFSFLKEPEEWGHGTNVQCMCPHRHDVVQNPCDLTKQGYNRQTDTD